MNERKGVRFGLVFLISNIMFRHSLAFLLGILLTFLLEVQESNPKTPNFSEHGDSLRQQKCGLGYNLQKRGICSKRKCMRYNKHLVSFHLRNILRLFKYCISVTLKSFLFIG